MTLLSEKSYPIPTQAELDREENYDEGLVVAPFRWSRYSDQAAPADLLSGIPLTAGQPHHVPNRPITH